MRKLILVFLLLISGISYASDSELYLVERPDGGVSVLQYFPGSKDSLQDVLRDMGFSGYPIERISKNDLPTNRADRKYWKRGVLNKIEIDTAKKTADQVAEAAKDARKKTLLKMTDSEFQEAKQLGIVK